MNYCHNHYLGQKSEIRYDRLLNVAKLVGAVVLCHKHRLRVRVRLVGPVLVRHGEGGHEGDGRDEEVGALRPHQRVVAAVRSLGRGGLNTV